MALAAEIIFEFRTTGSNDNGGGFKAGASGTDYSQQDAAQLTLTDLAMVTGGTTLTSATGGFTAAMIGNVIYIKSGTHFVAGWYEITARADTNTVTIDRDATDGTNGSAGTGSVGGARALPTDAFFEALTAGNTVYIKNTGTYTLTENIDVALDGTSALPFNVIGYNATRGDNPVGNNRPIILCGAYTWIFDDYWQHQNLNIVGSAAPLFRLDTSGIVRNCKIINNSGTASRIAIHFGSTQGLCIDNEICSILGNGINVYRSCLVINNFIYSCNVNGIYFDISNFILGNIFAYCTTGISIASFGGQFILNNTIYNSTTGISGTTSAGCKFLNNIIDSCTTGASWSSEIKSNFWDYNNWHDNSTDVSNVTKGANDTANDPEFEFVGVLGTDDSGVNNKTTYTVDTSENFTTLGVTVGDTILNKTDGSWGTITSISTTTNPNDTVNFSGGLTGGADNDFDNGDTYSILGNFALKTTSQCRKAAFGIRLGVD